MYPDPHGSHLLAATYAARFPYQDAVHVAKEPEAVTRNLVAMCAPVAA